MSILKNAQDLCALMGQGKSMEAFEKYYHDNVTVVEATGETREGKDSQREAIQQWQGMVKEFHGGGIGSIAVDEANGITTVQSWTDITNAQGNRLKLEEVAVQKWEGDQIIHERFYYNPGNWGG